MIYPLSDYVLLVRSKPETITSSGLHIPESAANSAANRGYLARVLATGPGRRTNDGMLLWMSVQVGDQVIINKHHNATAEVATSGLNEEVVEWLLSLDVDSGRDILLMLRESEILALVQERVAGAELWYDVPGEQTANPEEAFAGLGNKLAEDLCAQVVDLMQALKDSLRVAAQETRRRDELAEERARRYTHEDGTPK